MSINDRELDRLLYKYYSEYDNFVVVPEGISERIQGIDFKSIYKRVNVVEFIKRVIAVITAFVTVSGGLAIANKYVFKGDRYSLGKGIRDAVEHGYILEQEGSIASEISSPDIVLNNSKLEIGIQDFLMDDQTICDTFRIKFDDVALEKIDLSKVGNIELYDLVMFDENNNILFSLDKGSFNSFCEENKLDYDFSDFNDNYYSSGVNSLLKRTENDNELDLVYNVYTNALYGGYPRSKKVYYKFSKVRVKEVETENIIELDGDWSFVIDVPEVMYNRSSVSYRVVSCSDDDVKVYACSVGETGTEIGLRINNIPEVKIPKELEDVVLRDKENSIDVNEDEEYQRLFREWFDKLDVVDIDETYVVNESGEKFYSTMGVNRKYKSDWVSENEFEFVDTYSMIKDTASDRIELNLRYNGKSAKIVLEKVL